MNGTIDQSYQVGLPNEYPAIFYGIDPVDTLTAKRSVGEQYPYIIHGV